MMEIRLADHAGFCFGVKLAVEQAKRIVEENPNTRIYMLGHLIHNTIVTEYFRSHGVVIIEKDEIDGIFQACSEECPAIVILRTHGVEREIMEKVTRYAAEKSTFRFCDTTCPNVKKIHTIVAREAVGDTVCLVYGDPSHPEVAGITSYAACPVYVCQNAENLANLLEKNHNFDGKKILAVSQTTQKLTEWKLCQKFIEKYCTNSIIFDTICSVTEKRQTEAAVLAGEVDMMLVIGSAHSSNSNKLFAVSKEVQPQTYFIEQLSDLPLSQVTENTIMGITAGASTPSSIIEEVINTMAELQNKIETLEEDFAEMLEESFKTIKTGETVVGTITFVSENEIHVDLGTKVTGIVPYSELTDTAGAKVEDLYKVGDQIETIVVKISDLDGVATLSKKRIDGIKSWRTIQEAAANDTILEGTISEVVKGGLIMQVEGTKLFIPASQSGLPKEADLSTLLRTTHKVKILEINDQRRRAVASIKAVEREERKAKEAQLWETIEIGNRYHGTVKSLTSYGAFVDLGGVDGMVHSSELSWRRIKHPSEVVSVGDEIDVFVKDLDREKKRISLGYKTPESDPWNIFNSKYQLNDVVPVKIVSMMPFGAFAEVVPGADGLIHISQIVDRKITKPADVLEIGQVVDAKIIGIDMDNHKISLSMRALIENTDAEAEEIFEEASEEAADAE